MTLSRGTSLGSFEITGSLGSGAMGEVYRARDSKLGREVAIKVLPEVFAKDAERLARFEREAKVLASLNHPNIAGIYEFGHENEIHFLVMELVEGETLEEKLWAGAMSIEDALPIYFQLGEALDAAHEQGIVHRDLKPANIKVTEAGRVKVLDFGLAKALERKELLGSDSSSGGALELGSLDSGAITREGYILGSPAYMSPEQARGHKVDRRADIWAFGCCLYETLTGQRPFQGETVSDMLAEILKSDPDWSLLPGDTPESVRVLLRRCLERDRQKRLKDAGDIANTLEEARTSAVRAPLGFSSERGEQEMSAVGSAKRSYLWTLLAGVVLIALAGGAWWLNGAGRRETIAEAEAAPKAAPNRAT